MKKIFCLFATVAALFLAESRAKATFINAATTGLANPTTTITFSEIVLTNGTVLSNQYSALGVTFQGMFYNPVGSAPVQNAAGEKIGNFSEVADLENNLPPANITNPFSIFFSDAVTAATFAFATDIGNTTFQALLDGVVVESATVPTDFADNTNFYGFTNILFDQIQFRVTTTGGLNAALLDNLQFITNPSPPPTAQGVPAPASLILVGMGLVSAFGARRFRR